MAAPIEISAFGGLNPITDPHLLQPQEAVTANNVRLIGGTATPLLGTTVLQALKKTAPATIWRFGNSPTETNWWYEFLADTDVIRSPIEADPFDRSYWADGVEPRYGPSSVTISGSTGYPGASYKLGIPAPAAALTASGTPSTAATAETRVYVYTYVSAYGEEGPPSPPSAAVTIDPTLSVGLSGMSGAPSGAYNITTKRIYRSSTVGASAEYQFDAEIPVANTTYTDTASQADLGEVLPTEGWIAPPADLRGLRLLPGGAAVGFSGNTVCYSEPNQPHAWPHRYPFSDTIVGLAVFGQSVAVLTTGTPHLMTGSDPAAMSSERLNLQQSCSSKRSIVETGDGVIYASPDGLVSIGSSGMSLPTGKLLRSDQWLAYNPSSMACYQLDGRVHVFYTTTGGARGELVFDFTGQGAQMATTDLPAATAVTAAYSDPRTDTLYLAQGTDIVRYGKGSALQMTWSTKVFRSVGQRSISVIAIDATSYASLTLHVYADGALVHTRTVTSSDPFWIPGGYRARDWRFEVQGYDEVLRLRAGRSMQEMAES